MKSMVHLTEVMMENKVSIDVPQNDDEIDLFELFQTLWQLF
jgi:LPS O-antigen subunit length determinant protein (WzzB/FepE family)